MGTNQRDSSTTMTPAEKDWADFTKFSKFFTTRMVQSVVQSRLGQKVRTECSVGSTASDWFNVNVEELGEVTSEIRASLKGKFPPHNPDFCLDFQLQTTEGEVLPLEIWSIHFDSDHCDPKFGIRTHLYYQMSVLLRSAIAASRVTPAYRYYSRKQSSDSFIICYQLREGKPDLDSLGEGAKEVRLGYLPCAFGTLYLHLYYRTKMIIAGPEEGIKEAPRAFSSQRRNLPGSLGAPIPPRSAISPNTDRDSPQDDCYSTFSTSPPSGEFWAPAVAHSPGARRPSVTFQVGIEGGAQASGSESSTSGRQDLSGHSHSSSSAHSAHGTQGMRTSSSQGLFRMEGIGVDFKPSSLPAEQYTRKRKESFPFAALLTASSAPSVAPRPTLSSHSLTNSLGASDASAKPVLSKSRSIDPPESDPATPTADESRKSSTRDTPVAPLSPEKAPWSPDRSEDDEDSSDDSFVKVDFAPIFGTSGEPFGSDLGDFVRECKTAPPQLRSFEFPHSQPQPAQPPQAEAAGGETRNSLENLPKEIESFKNLQTTFDDFVQSLAVSQSEDD